MGCTFGTTNKVKKIVITPQQKAVEEHAQIEIKEDDLIKIPKDKRKIFKVDFDLKAVLPPQYSIIKTYDYSTDQSQFQILGEMARQQLRVSKQLIRELNQTKSNYYNSHSEITQLNKFTENEVSLKIIDESYQNRERQQLVLS